MTPWFRAAALSAAALSITATSVLATDLGYPPEQRYGRAYDDPRYAELYGDEPTRPPARELYEPRPAPRYVERPYGAPIPREPIYRDLYRHDRGPPRGYASGPSCLGKDEVKYRLEILGWSDFRAPSIEDARVAWVKARRPSGRTFHLQVDRCSGEIISAQPLEPRYGAYDQGPPRWRY